ncbi:MAG: Crp/Fnr family transcriptional regulator [Micromonosporaceae bacterium]|nr:Crp/Fnr family transcriptional regulator [Micromonosporaceae bacterium]
MSAGIHRPYRFAASLAAQECADLLAAATQRSFAEGQELLAQGDTSDHVLILRRGCVKIVASSDRQRAVLLGLRGPGDLIGEMRYLSGAPRSAAVIAADPVVALIVTFDALEMVLRKHTRIMGEIARCVTDRLRWADRRRAEFCLPVTMRVARVLYELGVAAVMVRNGGGNLDGPAGVEIPVTQRELGQLVGAAEVSVQKALRQLAHSGWVARRYGRVSIIRLEALRTYSE